MVAEKVGTSLSLFYFLFSSRFVFEIGHSVGICACLYGPVCFEFVCFSMVERKKELNIDFFFLFGMTKSIVLSSDVAIRFLLVWDKYLDSGLHRKIY